MRAICLIAAGLSILSACVAPRDPAPETVATATTVAGDVQSVRTDTNRQTWRITDITVIVPSSLSVSRNPDDRFPDTDIVWWGDPPENRNGDRRAQVAEIVATAAGAASAILDGWREVTLQIEVLRFHSLTPSSRELGAWGFHDLDFAMSVIDAETGAEISRIDNIEADFNAFQRGDAIAADARGETQKVRVSRRIEAVTRQWLASGLPPSAS